jgi:hypothetical protein
VRINNHDSILKKAHVRPHAEIPRINHILQTTTRLDLLKYLLRYWRERKETVLTVT